MKHIKPLPVLTEAQIFHFWQKVDKTSPDTDCWIWKGAKSPKGYGIFTISQRGVKAHRIAFHLAGKTTTPETPLVCHGPCHNPSCVNPDHLEAGSAKKNIADKVRDGTKRIGVDLYNAKLDEDKVREIRRRYADGDASSQQLGAIFQVDPSIILDCVYRRTWRHVDPFDSVKLPNQPYTPHAKGESNPAAKITEDDVRNIRALRLQRWTLKQIAAQYGLSISNIHDIIRRKIWAHVDPDRPPL